MSAERMNELAALYAVGALDGADLREFEARLAEADATACAAAAQFNNLAGLIGAAQAPVQHPRPEIKERIMARIAGRSGQASSVPAWFNVLSHEGEWKELPVPGVRVKHLATDRERRYTVKLYAMDAGMRFPEHAHGGDEQTFVLSGDLHIEGRVLRAGDFHHAPARSQHRESFTEHGCQVLIIAPLGEAG